MSRGKKWVSNHERRYIFVKGVSTFIKNQWQIWSFWRRTKEIKPEALVIGIFVHQTLRLLLQTHQIFLYTRFPRTFLSLRRAGEGFLNDRVFRSRLILTRAGERASNSEHSKSSNSLKIYGCENELGRFPAFLISFSILSIADALQMTFHRNFSPKIPYGESARDKFGIFVNERIKEIASESLRN